MSLRKSHTIWKLLPVVRVIAVLSAVGIVSSLVTFAAIQSTGNALTGNTIQTATANLQISRDGNTYSDNVAGFNFTGLVPGGPAQPAASTYTVYLRNTGTAALRLSLTVPVVPSVTGTVDLSKVMVCLTPVVNLGQPALPTQTIVLAQLVAGTVSVDNSLVAIGANLAYHVQVSMSADAVAGNGATISNLNLSFSGTPQ